MLEFGMMACRGVESGGKKGSVKLKFAGMEMNEERFV